MAISCSIAKHARGFLERGREREGEILSVIIPRMTNNGDGDGDGDKAGERDMYDIFFNQEFPLSSSRAANMVTVTRRDKERNGDEDRWRWRQRRESEGG